DTITVYFLQKRRGSNESKAENDQVIAAQLVNLLKGRRIKEVVIEALSTGNLETIKLLSSVGIQDFPIDTAVRNGHLSLVRYLLEKLDPIDPTEIAALMVVAASLKHTDITIILLKKYKSLCLRGRSYEDVEKEFNKLEAENTDLRRKRLHER